jgi:hypothetical protein
VSVLEGLQPKGAALVLLTGAIAGTLMDTFHTFSGTTHYFHPAAFQTAWWVPPLFATAYLLQAVTFVQFRKLDPAPIDRGKAIAAFVAFAVVYFLSGFAPVSNLGKLAICAGAGLAGALFLRSKAALISGLIGAVVGPAFEVFLTGIGGFEHLQPDLWRIPFWLPGLYLASGPGIGPLLGAWLSPQVKPA